MSSNSDLIDSKRTQLRTQATNVNNTDYKNRFKPITFETSSNQPNEKMTAIKLQSAALAAAKSNTITKTLLPIPTSPLQTTNDTTVTTSTNTTNDLPDIPAEHKSSNGMSVKDTMMFNSFFPLNMNDSIKEEANDTLTRDELDITRDSDDEPRQQRQVKKDIEDGEIVDQDESDDQLNGQDDDDDKEDAEFDSDEELSKKKHKSTGSHDDQESYNSDDEYIEESDYQSQSPTCQNRSDISSDQSETRESP